ncbi:hypothetical protein EYF80_013665 [Liparis tanakae]|uniref:Uncharacterized protein n=1 Tax=Liparis tanakae TaxID=230148 RepID=A0A4Z2IFA6_9TELE|nr:hypothetical protein EYF80_013665 [Liparis tanakae]
MALLAGGAVLDGKLQLSIHGDDADIDLWKNMSMSSQVDQSNTEVLIVQGLYVRWTNSMTPTGKGMSGLQQRGVE